MPAAMGLSHRILLVEDDDDERQAITCALETEGAEVTSVADGWEALHALRNGRPPCVILLDLALPGMAGSEFRRRQLLWPQMARIPVVVLSGHPQLQAATRAMKARAVLAKPVQLSRLIRAVDEYCSDADAEAGAVRLRLMRTHAWSSASVRRR